MNEPATQERASMRRELKIRVACPSGHEERPVACWHEMAAPHTLSPREPAELLCSECGATMIPSGFGAAR